MDALNVQPEQRARKPVTTCGTIAADLRRVADGLDAVADMEVQLDPYVTLGIQPGGTDQEIAARTDAIGRALLGEPGEPQRMGGNTWHYKVGGRIGVVRFDIYDQVSDPEASEREAELGRLRARVAELEAADNGLSYTRVDGDADDPTPVSPARGPLHVGDAESQIADDGARLGEPGTAPVTTRPLVSDETIAEAAATEERDRLAGGFPWEVPDHPENAQPGGWHHGQIR